jgi:hypothetical protein
VQRWMMGGVALLGMVGVLIVVTHPHPDAPAAHSGATQQRSAEGATDAPPPPMRTPPLLYGTAWYVAALQAVQQRVTPQPLSVAVSAP